jgi:hypothetical protein
MNTDNTQDGAEPSPASAGSQPAAFLVEGHGRYASTAVFLLQEDADAYRTTGATISPLFRQPQPALTDKEREAVGLAAGDYLYHQDPGGRAKFIRETLLGLMERTK